MNITANAHTVVRCRQELNETFLDLLRSISSISTNIEINMSKHTDAYISRLEACGPGAEALPVLMAMVTAAIQREEDAVAELLCITQLVESFAIGSDMAADLLNVLAQLSHLEGLSMDEPLHGQA